MYAFIQGKIVEKTDNSVIINNGGIGYEIFCSMSTLGDLGAAGQEAMVLTHLHVREDAFMLYGFATSAEKKLFLDLTGVSGIGPKMASTILSGMSPNNLLSAIIGGDITTLSSIKGLGKKTAERIVLELKGSLDTNIINANIFTDSPIATDPRLEAIEVLVGMGMQRIESTNLIKAVYVDGDTTEKLIEKSLKGLK